jgi:hypothetical protein
MQSFAEMVKEFGLVSAWFLLFSAFRNLITSSKQEKAEGEKFYFLGLFSFHCKKRHIYSVKRCMLLQR